MKIMGALVAALLIASPVAPAAVSMRLTMNRALDASVVQQINDVRAANGLPPLRVNPRLAHAAALHTREMATAGYFGHESPDGLPFWKRVQRFYRSTGCSEWSVGENIVWGSPDLSSEDVVGSWLRSPEHRANLLNRNWREIGLAAARVPSAPGAYGEREATIVTADFGARSR